ncbi:MAG: 6-phosphofructokinase [Succinivibrionaceae bacterium]|nr:6-phosphofructokinase [Succinivibrionaceae bacterium]MEE1340953.1 6-phosphofructokinase [Succinivibrionaceae bacterium]
MIKRIGVLTSGGDAPGMNPAIRAVVRAGIDAGFEVYGIRDGYLGMHQDRIQKMNALDVVEIINRGGTILGTSRFTAFEEESVRKEAIDNLKKHDIDALVVIGGDGSYMGALKLSQMGMPCIGVPGTIDNDVHGTDYTIGFDTAFNTVVECMDRLKDTSSSHKRVSIVEIMGRHCGDLAMHAGVASGADFAIIPEKEFNKEDLFNKISTAFSQGKRYGLVALCEHVVNAENLAQEVETFTGIECRATVLGHLQRGGKPSAQDRLLGSRLGGYAVELLKNNIINKCVGLVDNKLVNYDIDDCINNQTHHFEESIIELVSHIG